MPYLLTAIPGNPTNWVKMETENILTGALAAKPSPTNRSNYSRRTTTLPKSNLNVNNFPTLPPLPPVPGNLTSLSNYSLSRNINNLNTLNNYHQFSPGLLYSNNLQSPYHTSVSVPYAHNGVNHHRANGTQVNILPPTEDWADNTTALSGFSDTELEAANLHNSGLANANRDLLYQESWSFRIQRFSGYYLCLLLCLVSYFSPLAMLVLPQAHVFPLRNSQLKCDVECDGLLISFSFKMICLAIGTWGVFYRKPKATLPRLHLFRCLTSLLVFVLTLSFWLFYAVRLMEQRRKVQYNDIVKYAGSYLDSLLVLHYLALILLEIRHGQPKYLVRVVRSPDGESGSFLLGPMSIQSAATKVLDEYYTSFTVYNPYLDQLPVKGRRDNYKYYDVDGMGNYGQFTDKDSRVGSPTYRNCKKDFGHNDLFYEEYEYERRLKKRRARLITVTEEAFSHIKRVSTDNIKGPSVPMDSYEAAQTIFPSIVRPLQKYLRITRQQPRHTMDSILAHLANTITYDMAPKAFLEKYLVTRPVLQSEREQKEIQSWSLVSEVLVSRTVSPGSTFILKQGEVSLLVEVLALPHYSITENTHNPHRDRFTINRDPLTA